MDKKKSAKHPVAIGLVIVMAMIIGAVALYFIWQYMEYAAIPELYTERTVEAGDPVPGADVFLVEGQDKHLEYAADITTIDTSVPGTYPILVSCKEKIYTVSLSVVDTTAPQGTVQDLTVLQAQMPAAEDFVTEIRDVTDVTIRYQEAPDPENPEEQTVTILLTDAAGNNTQLTAHLTVIIDHEAPVIDGVKDISVYQGDAVAYRSGVTVTDNLDEAPQLTIDSSLVDLSTPGVYEVIYTAVDFTGNTASVTATVTVYEKKETYVDIAVINDAVDDILATIVNDSMTDREKVSAVFWWIRNHCVYVNSSSKEDWMQAGYQMLVTRHGDCYSYFALNKLMLERMEIPNIDVQKIPNYDGDSHHYWSLVSVDGGETYYHVDITPRMDTTIFLLVTDSFLDSYSAKNYNCFNRDKSLYPSTPEK